MRKPLNPQECVCGRIRVKHTGLDCGVPLPPPSESDIGEAARLREAYQRGRMREQKRIVQVLRDIYVEHAGKIRDNYTIGWEAAINEAIEEIKEQ